MSFTDKYGASGKPTVHREKPGRAQRAAAGPVDSVSPCQAAQNTTKSGPLEAAQLHFGFKHTLSVTCTVSSSLLQGFLLFYTHKDGEPDLYRDSRLGLIQTGDSALPCPTDGGTAARLGREEGKTLLRL